VKNCTDAHAATPPTTPTLARAPRTRSSPGDRPPKRAFGAPRLQRISGLLLDRIDIHIAVPRLQHEELLGRPQGEPSTVIRARVIQALQALQARFAKERGKLYANGAMEAGQIRKYCGVDGEVKELLRSAIQPLGLSARAYHRILKLSRTIADLAGAADIGVPHAAGCPQGGRSSIARRTGGAGGNCAG
jgi:predicted ATPase with chaperone activity